MTDNSKFYEVHNVSVRDIMADDEFNCRGAIIPFDVRDLVESIKRTGLQTPVTLVPNTAGRPFRIIAGFRRLYAYNILKYETIPAFVREGLTEQDMQIYNLEENLKRSQLNMVQEAKAIHKLVMSGLTYRTIATRLSKPEGWVKVRTYILLLPPDIQDEVAAGLLTNKQITAIAGFTNAEDQYAYIRKIKDGKIRNESVVEVIDKPPTSKHESKARSQQQIKEMLMALMDETGPALHTRVLAWAIGNISSDELDVDIANYKEDHAVIVNKSA